MYIPLGTIVDFERLIVKKRTFTERISIEFPAFEYQPCLFESGMTQLCKVRC
jgi:hypothetical protein